jgi:hypothetical protein
MSHLLVRFRDYERSRGDEVEGSVQAYTKGPRGNVEAVILVKGGYLMSVALDRLKVIGRSRDVMVLGSGNGEDEL